MQQGSSGRGSPTNTDYEDSGFEGGDDIDPSQINTVGVINPYAVKPASIKRVLIFSLPIWAATSVLSAVGLYKKPEEEDEVEEDGVPAQNLATEDGRTGADILKQAAEGAIAHEEKSSIYDKTAEAKAKKVAQKAKKLEARRRRGPVV
ncbi:hypothetical protein GGI12_004506 [Dipsacomyces acuminosporus]|nr:hypothetical protein GGI12_004506 [Dipsacomyces acuminosporus]